MPTLLDLRNLGQSAWLDFIEREFMQAGELQALIDRGLSGMTSNPSIFDQAIANSAAYDKQISALAEAGSSLRQSYEALVIADIQQAGDLLRPVYDETAGADGYVSLEVSPGLADDTDGTIEEVKHFHQAVDRPNLMIKIPATEAGYPAIQQMVGVGVNINITLMFSLGQYDRVAEAYLSGLEAFDRAGGDVSQVASVASFFVSRVDTKIDKRLDEIGEDSVRGKIGIANAKMAYRRFQQTFGGDRWKKLAVRGARLQRVLWGSTGTKDPAYPDTMYVDGLIGPHTINTLPPETLEAFVDHGTADRTVDQDLEAAERQLARLAELGVDLDQVTDELLEEGVAKFARSFDDLMETLGQKLARARSAPAKAR